MHAQTRNGNAKKRSSVTRKSKVVVQLYYSFRSPYSQLVAGRLRDLCSRYSSTSRSYGDGEEEDVPIPLEVHPMLPMVSVCVLWYF